MVVDGRAVSYSSAAGHYLSPSRRDQVKLGWEEPFSRRVLRRSVEILGLRPGASLRVVDVGAGTGDGLSLLDGALDEVRTTTGDRFDVSYLGIDVDPDMVDTASSITRDRPRVDFVVGDVREFGADTEFDLCMSAGVPYSHLSPEDFVGALTRIFTGRSGKAGRSVVVIDVLGRYSLEWTPRWGEERWDYAMSFFQDATEVITAPMTFYSRDRLARCIERAAHRAGLGRYRTEFHDRSITAGRHTATRAFNPVIPPYRTVLNAVSQGDLDVDLHDLLLAVPDGPSPPDVATFFRSFVAQWNQLVERALQWQATLGPSAADRVELVRALRRLEHAVEPGLGVGHSLIAVVTIPGAAAPAR